MSVPRYRTLISFIMAGLSAAGAGAFFVYWKIGMSATFVVAASFWVYAAIGDFNTEIRELQSRLAVERMEQEPVHVRMDVSGDVAEMRVIR